MRGKIYEARFFEKVSGVEITLDEAKQKNQNDTTMNRAVYVIYKLVDAEKFMITEGIVNHKSYFHEVKHFSGYQLVSSECFKIESIGTISNLENQDAELAINFCIGFKNFIDNNGIFQQEFYGFYPFFVKEYLDTIKQQKLSNYEFYIFFFDTLNVWCGLIHVASIEGNIIIDTNGNTYKVVGFTKITCS